MATTNDQRSKKKKTIIGAIVSNSNSCPDYDPDCMQVVDPACCYYDCFNTMGGRADGFCPLLVGSLKERSAIGFSYGQG